MTELIHEEFISEIARRHNVSNKMEYSIKIPCDKKRMKQFTSGRAHKVRIFNGVKEFPYMLSDTQRNDEALVSAIELRVKDYKTLAYIKKETGVVFELSPCEICEGGGWYRNGTKITYQNIFTTT